MVSEAQKLANAKWDKENMAYQTIKVRKELLDEFKATCVACGDRVNTVLRQAMEDYVSKNKKAPTD